MVRDFGGEALLTPNLIAQELCPWTSHLSSEFTSFVQDSDVAHRALAIEPVPILPSPFKDFQHLCLKRESL